MRNTTTVDFKSGKVMDDGSTGLGRLLDRVMPGNLGERWDNLTQKQRRTFGLLAAVAITAIGVNVPVERTVGSAPEHLTGPIPAKTHAEDIAQHQLDTALQSANGKIGAQVLEALDSARNKNNVLNGIGNQDGRILDNPSAITAGEQLTLPEVDVVNKNTLLGMIAQQPGGTRVVVQQLSKNS